MVLLFWAERN